MKKRLLLMLITITYYSFNCQSIDVLASKNGFRDIKLQSDIKEYNYALEIKGEVAKILEESNIWFWEDYDYVFDNEGMGYTKISDAEIWYIFVNTYKDSISEIKIQLDFTSDFLDLIESAYGQPQWNNSQNGSIDLAWHIDDISCRLMCSNSCVLTYTNKSLKERRFDYNSKQKSKKALNEF